MGRAVLAPLKVGEDVTVHRLKAAALSLIDASSISNASRQTVVDNAPRPHTRAKREGWFDRGARQTTIQGRVRMTLHGRRGEVKRALLERWQVVPMPRMRRYDSHPY